MAEGMTTDSILCYRMLFRFAAGGRADDGASGELLRRRARAELARPLGLLLWVGYSALPGLWEYVERDGHDAASSIQWA